MTPRPFVHAAVVALATGTLGCWTGTAAPAAAADPPQVAAQPPPRPRSPAASRCEVTSDAPVRMTSMGEIRVELAGGEQVASVRLTSAQPDGGLVATLRLTGGFDSISVSPGTYTIEIDTASHQRERCEGVTVAAGQLTTVRVVGAGR